MKIVYFLISILLAYLCWLGAESVKSRTKDIMKDPGTMLVYMNFVASAVLFVFLSFLIINNFITVETIENVIRRYLPD
jgi:large-conductance mechanosensitive channel